MNTIRPPLDPKALACLAPTIEQQLRDRLALQATAGLASPARRVGALNDVLLGLMNGECTAEDQRRYLLFIAPIVRRLVLNECGSSGEQTAQELEQIARWIARLETFDPLSVLMIDLHYFCGLGARETAAVVGVSAHTVIRDLRFARAWLLAYMGKAGATRL